MTVTNALKSAPGSYASGQLHAALSRAEAALKTDPNNVAALQFVGVNYAQNGHAAKSVGFFRRALKLRPLDLSIAFNLARALFDIDECVEAEAICSAHAADPNFVRLRGDIRKSQARLDEAVADYQAVVEKLPDDAGAWNNLGTSYLQLERFADAASAFDRASPLQPDSTVIMRNRATALLALGREEEAVAILKDAAQKAPRDPAVLLDLGQALTRVAQYHEALAFLGEAARIDSSNAQTFVAIGLTFASLGEFDRAEQAYEFALRADANHPPALLNLGVLLEQSNRIEPLEQLLTGALARGVEGDEISALRALVLRRQGEFGQALEAARAIESDAVDEIMATQLVAQLADRAGEIDLAFESFTRMNDAMARNPIGRAFDGTEHRKFVEGLSAVTTPDWFAGWSAHVPSPVPPSPVFLIGFPRSGTTLLDTALMGHSRVHVLEEEPILGNVRDQAGELANLATLSAERIDELRNRYFEELNAIAPATGDKLIIDKLPLNILRGPLIHRLFPDARIIFALRHPCDAVLSCFMQNFKINQAMASFLTLENSARFYDAVMSYWSQARSIIPFNVHEFRYEAMVQDRESSLRDLTAFLGLEWEDSLLEHEKTAADRHFIRTPSYAQVTEKIYTRARGRWEFYRDQMAGVLPVLTPWIGKFGYDGAGPADAAA